MPRSHQLPRLASAMLPAFERIPRLPPSPPTVWDHYQQLHARIEKARAHGLHLAERKLRSELRSQIDDVRQHLDAQYEQLIAVLTPNPSTCWKQLLADLMALEQEFGAVEFDLR